MKNNTTNARFAGRVSALAAMMLVASAQAAEGAEAFSAESPWMTGDWGGERTRLIEQGYDFTLDYVGEVGSNLSGGYNDDTTAR